MSPDNRGSTVVHLLISLKSQNSKKKKKWNAAAFSALLLIDFGRQDEISPAGYSDLRFNNLSERFIRVN